MRSGYVGNRRLQSLVKSGGAMMVTEVVEVEDSHVKDVRSDWAAGTVSPGGGAEFLNSGGATLVAADNTIVAEVANDGATLNLLTHIPTFNAVMVTWAGTDAPNIEIHNMVARLDSRRDGGQPVTVSEWRAQLFRVTRILQSGIEEGGFTVLPISREVVVPATGEAPADFTFNFEGLSGGRYPVVGPRPTNEGGPLPSGPMTMVRIIALQDDGAPADNVAWMANSGQSSASAGGYVAEACAVLRLLNPSAEEVGGSAYRLSTGADYPEFTLDQAEYVEAEILFDGGNEVPDLPGSGDLVIVARGETPADSSITYQLDDGGGFVECFDGDVIGVDKSGEGGGDLSGISTTGPWDLNVVLTPGTADLTAPTVREFGIERVVRTLLRGVTTLKGGGQAIDPRTLKGGIAAADLVIAKTGENDYRDYGSKLLSRSHIGQITVRRWLADRDGSQLHRSEWMLRTAWDVDNYYSTADAHVLNLISPLRRLHNITIPPFVAVSGNDGTRTAVRYEGTLKGVSDDLVDATALAGRFRGPGVEDDTTTCGKLVTRSDAKDELDRVAFIDGSAYIESQGRIRAVKVLRDGPGADTPVAFFPHGTYDAGDFGPGYSTRTDECFVLYDWNEPLERFDGEVRHLNAVAALKLGGVGINTTQTLDEEMSKWITSEATANAVGARVPYHFATGQIAWPIFSHVPHPELEIGDVVAIETTRFVGRSPLSDEELRGRVSATAIVIAADDEMGQAFTLWVPSFDKIVPASGTVTRRAFARNALLHSDATSRAHTGDTAWTTKQAFEVPALYQAGTFYEARIRAVFLLGGAGGTKDVRITYRSGAIHSVSSIASGGQNVVIEVMLRAASTTGYQSTFIEPLVPGFGGFLSTPFEVNTPADIDFDVQLTDAGDTATLVLSEIEWRKAA